MELVFATVIEELKAVTNPVCSYPKLINRIYESVHHKAPKYFVADVKPTYASKIKSREENVRRKIQNGAADPAVTCEMPAFIQKYVIPLIDTTKHSQLMDNLLTIVRNDKDIGPSTRAKAEYCAQKGTLADFLAVIFQHALTRDNRRKKALHGEYSEEIYDNAAHQDEVNIHRRSKGNDNQLPLLRKQSSDAEHPLSHNVPPILDRYIPRRTELRLLQQKFNNGHKQVFIWGEGGVGKTEFVLSFAAQMRQEYECFFTTFKGSIEETILQLDFKNWSPYQKNGDPSSAKSREMQYSEKLRLLQQYGMNCLLIIDNTDIPPDQLLNDPRWRDMERLDILQIYTTRYEFDKANIEIKPFSTKALVNYLQKHYVNPNTVAREELCNLVEYVERHTLTVDLIGRLLKSSKGRVSPNDILIEMQNSTPDDSHWSAVSAEYNRDYTKRSLYNHLQVVFDLSALSANELKVMRWACLFPRYGMDCDFLLRIVGDFYQDVIDSLCEAGWLRYRENRNLAMHPLVQVICRYGETSRPSWENVQRFADSLMDICHMPSMYFMPQIAKFPIKQAYTCLNNILQLADIPLEKSADICELMGWELHLAFHPTKDRSFHDFVRILSLDSALEYREAAQEKEKQQYNALFPMEYVPRDKDLSSLVNIYYKLGCVYGSFRTFDYDASECFQKAAELLSACHNPDYFSVANLYGYTAYAYLKQNAPEQTISFLEKAMKAFRKAKQNQRNHEPNQDYLDSSGFDFFYPSPYPYVYIERDVCFWNYSDLVQHILSGQLSSLLTLNIYVVPDN